MLKLTDPNYFLPIIDALEAGRILQSGRTKPMIVRGVCTTTGFRGEYVVKLKGSDQMWQGSSMNEILGSFIARELGFFVPEPVIVNVSKDFLEGMAEVHENYELASKSIGFNFGSSLEDAYRELVPGQQISEVLKEQLFNMFALDIYIGNPDRRSDKPNFLSNGKNLLIYDHELAFSFTQLLFGGNPEPWKIPNADLEWISKNYCYTHLKGNNYDFSNFSDRLSVITEAFWQKARKMIPQEWQNDKFEIIKNCLNKITAHKDIFASELNRILL